ncbi:MAG TPA: hypothetical protein DCQ06_10805 [Myxococcales bacterium]|nr:hypothetical protein [Myxococcales bacterium]HAN32076.1 hypothetical protein [Myxococcales bacterium]
MKQLTSLLCVLLTVSTLSGCYNTYRVPSIEFRKLQSREALSQDRILQDKIGEDEGKALLSRNDKDAIAVKTIDGKQVAVTRDTRIFARSEGGRRYQVTPFSFSMYSSQLVASDRDTLKPLAALKSYEVDLLSTPKTTGIIAAGIALATGFIVVTALRAGTKSFN